MLLAVGSLFCLVIIIPIPGFLPGSWCFPLPFFFLRWKKWGGWGRKKLFFTFAAFCLAWISIMLFIVVLFLLPALSLLALSVQLMLPEPLEFHSFVVAQVFATFVLSICPFLGNTLCCRSSIDSGTFLYYEFPAHTCWFVCVFLLVMDKLDADSTSRFIINFASAAHTLQTCKLRCSQSTIFFWGKEKKKISRHPRSSSNFIQSCSVETNLKFCDKPNEI